MRELSSPLLDAQKANTLDPKPKLVLSKAGESDVTYTESRILSIDQEEQPYRVNAKVLLDNSDGALTALDFKGWKAVLYWGLVTLSGDEFSEVTPFKVIWQQLDSSPGRLTCELTMLGIPDSMDGDSANADYLPEDTDTKTIKTLIREIVGDTGVTFLACFNHCQAYDVIFDSEDSLIDTYKPKDSFRIYIGGSRLAAIQRLLPHTKCGVRFEEDSKLHILQPIISTETAWAPTTGYNLRDTVIPIDTPNKYQYICTTAGNSAASEPAWPTGIGDTVEDGGVVWTVAYDYKYSLQDQHTFFAKAYRKVLILPNHITVKSLKDDDPQYQGTATSADSYALMPQYDYYKTSLESNAQATSIAEAIIANLELKAEMGAVTVPMNCGAELFDFVLVIDEREEDYRKGNIGSLIRKYRPGKYEMQFTFGDPPIIQYVKGLYDDMNRYSSGVFDRLKVKNLYAEKIVAGNIDFTDITYDLIQDGVDYHGVKSAQINADGLIFLDEIVDEGGTYKRAKSASFDAEGMLALDKVSDGDYRRTKAIAVNAGGLIVLDEVVEGDYGLVAKTDISAGHIKLSTVEQSSSYRTVTDSNKGTWNGKPDNMDEIPDGADWKKVLATDISSGHILLSSVTQSSSYRTASDGEKGVWSGKPDDMDEIGEGYTYQKVKATDLSSGHIKLTTYTSAYGKWYEYGGVILDATYGIKIDSSATYGALAFKYGGYSATIELLSGGWLQVRGVSSGIVQISTIYPYGTGYIGGASYRWNKVYAKYIDLNYSGGYIDMTSGSYIDLPVRSSTPTWAQGRAFYYSGNQRIKYGQNSYNTWRET